MAEELVEERTITDTEAWFEGLDADQLYGLEVIPVDTDGNEGDPIYLMRETRAAEAPAEPDTTANTRAVFGDEPTITVQLTEATGAHTYRARVLDSDDTVVEEQEWTAQGEGTTHELSVTVPGSDFYFAEVEAINEVGTTTVKHPDIGVGVYAGGGASPEPTVSHATEEEWTYDSETRYPAYMAGQVFVDGTPAQRDVLILDRITFDILYTPRVHDDGTWEVRNITKPPRDIWRAYAAVFRDIEGAYNAEIIDHIEPAQVGGS